MKREEFVVITKLLTSYWGDSFDEFKIENWYDIFKDFKFEGLRMTIQSLAKETRYQPKINDIIDRYQRLKNDQLEERKLNRQKEILQLTAGQEECVLCDNKGFVLVNIKGYEYCVRCICPHGKDLNLFSYPEQDKNIPYINRITGKQENIYIPTIKEALTDDDYAIFYAKKKVAKANLLKQAEKIKKEKEGI